MGAVITKAVGGAVALLLLSAVQARAQQDARLSVSEAAEVVALVDQGGSKDLLRQLALAAIPETYENAKHWGGTTRVWNGVRVSLDGLRLKTKRRWRDVNHGTWKRYRAWLIDPEKQFDLRIENVRPAEGSSVAFEIAIDAKLGLFARLSQWERGVQLISLSTDAEAVVRLRLTCEASMKLDFEQIIPDLVIEPEITAADLTLVSFDLQRVSNLQGPGVEQLGRSLRDVLQEEINERRPKLVAQANRQIEKNRDKLRLSISELGDDGWERAGRLLQKLP
ncbi:MAG: hypothetical protein O3C40_10340 [Planctomycetota bacterium]|nr:hypothetical protein [Planctomycetota bacterium]